MKYTVFADGGLQALVNQTKANKTVAADNTAALDGLSTDFENMSGQITNVLGEVETCLNELDTVKADAVKVNEELNKKSDVGHTHINYASTVTTTGSGNAITDISKSGDTITATKGSTFALSVHSHTSASTSAAGFMSAADKSKLDGIATGANAYAHPTTSGNKHIPSGGSSGQILRWAADGTAEWGTDNNNTYSEATQSAQGLMSAADKKKLDGIATGANAYTHPSYTARTGVPTANQTPAFGGTFSVSQPVSDATGHVTEVNSRTITIPKTEATTSAAGLMSASDKTKLDGIDEGANAYTHPTSHPASMITGLSTVATSGKYSDLSGKPTTMKNPNALTFTGSATGTYDGSSAVSVEIPKGSLVGTTAEITPAQVEQALSDGRTAVITHTDSTFGTATYTCFVASLAFDAVIASGIAMYGGNYIVMELLGFISSGNWTLMTTGIAEKSDIPTTLPNPNAITFTGAVTGTYDGSAAKTVNIPVAPVSSVNGKTGAVSLSASDVGADASGSANTALTNAKSYTDTKISALINSAPTTLDTLGEIATAMENSADVVEALETAVGTKANASDLTAHTGNKSNPHGVTLSQLGVTATAAELNKMDGVTATTTEINYVDGVTSNIQTQLNALSAKITALENALAALNVGFVATESDM